jgi:hypothetical protein
MVAMDGVKGAAARETEDEKKAAGGSGGFL